MDIYRETMLARTMAFKDNGDELWDEPNDVIEITDVTATHVEIAFDGMKQRIYIQLPLGELLTRALAFGKQPDPQ